jgi:predicted ester cyclase
MLLAARKVVALTQGRPLTISPWVHSLLPFGRTMRFTGTTVLHIVDGKIAEEIGEEDAFTALTQLSLVRPAT